MELMQAILRPGKVVEVLDNGYVRASAPGLFSAKDKDKLPPIMPFFGLHANTYSSPLVHDEIWVLNVTNNPQQLFWFRKDDYKENNKELIKEENVEIICNRETGSDWATIYFSDGSGWVIKKDESVIQIRPDGSILLDSSIPNRAIDISDKCISLGSVGESAHKAAYGDVVMEVLQKIHITLESVMKAAKSNGTTLPISIAIKTHINSIEELIPKTVSDNVTLD
jgi:hypothetical protein